MRAAEQPATPVADAEHASLFSAVPRAGRLILAVSGGADSLALMWLAQRWRAAAPGPELVVATVDHGLRPESAAETATVAAQAQAIGLPHETLVWSGPKPTTAIEATARAARYRLLFDFARRCGAFGIATAHTQDDQAETVLMRLAAGSGPAGLAGMRPSEPRDGLLLLRPLLGLPKARLLATVRAAGLTFAEDPTNSMDAFARGRLRRSAEVLAREGLTPARLATLAARMARHEDAIQAAAEAAAERLRHPDRPTRLDGWGLVGLPEELSLRVLAAAIRTAGGEPTRPHALRLQRLEALWQALRDAIVAGRPLRRTLAGALIVADVDRSVAVLPAPPRRSAPAAAAASEPVKDATTRSPHPGATT